VIINESRAKVTTVPYYPGGGSNNAFVGMLPSHPMLYYLSWILGEPACRYHWI